MRLSTLHSLAVAAKAVSAALITPASVLLVDSITLKNARQGDKYEAKLSGLIQNTNSTVQFSLEDSQGGSWAKVSQDGIISGTPDDSSSDRLKVYITASSPNQLSSSLVAEIPVRKASEPLVDRLKVLSWNLWYGGTKVDDYHRKQVRFLARSDVDIVGFQESGDDHAIRLAKAMGWSVYQGADVGIASRYPIDQEYPDESYRGAVRISLGGSDAINVWNAHLGYTPYGPYDFCWGNLSVPQVLENEEKSSRTPQIKSTVAAMNQQIQAADKVPVVLLGDFNAPSHLDWIQRTKNQHCGQGDMPWPTSVYPTKAGLVDSFREVNPDPVKEPGLTWSPIFKDNEGHKEPQDRIDFIYYAGKHLTLQDSYTVIAGKPRPEPDHEQNEWTSDHSAVVAIYKFGSKE